MKEVNRFLSSRIFEDDGECRVRVDDRRHQGDKGLGKKRGGRKGRRCPDLIGRRLSGCTTATRLPFRVDGAPKSREKFYFHFVIILLYSFFSLFFVISIT